MTDPEQLEKEKQLAAFREEIQKLIAEAKEKNKKGENQEYTHFHRMEGADSLTLEDIEWWEKVIKKDYTVSDFKGKEDFDSFYRDLRRQAETYRSTLSREKDADRYYFFQEIINKLGKLDLLEIEFESIKS